MITRDDLETVTRVAEELEKIWEIYAEANGYPKGCVLKQYWADDLVNDIVGFEYPQQGGNYDYYSMPIEFVLADYDEQLRLLDEAKRVRLERQAEAARLAREAALDRQQRFERSKLRELARQYPDVVQEIVSEGATT